MTRPRLIAAALLAAAVAVVAVTRAGGDGHVLRAVFPSAVNLVPGAEVRAGGVRVGSVRSITVHAGAARLELAIADERLWPLRAGTRARIRMGGTVTYSNRYVELEPGAGRSLPDGAELRAADTTYPFEFDQVLNVFDPKTRAGLGALIDRGATTLGPRGDTLRAALQSAGPALDQTAAVLEGIGADPHALSTLVRAGARTAGELAARDAQLRALVGDAATTLTAIADNGADVRRTLARLPVALGSARTTLSRLDRSLTGVDGLVHDLAPGARELRRASRPLFEAVHTLRGVSPSLEATLARVQRSGPTIARFLDDSIPTAKRLRPTLTRLAPMAACLRAYAPEIAGFLTTWQAPTYDASGRYARVLPQVMPFSDVSTSSSAAAQRQFPQMRYAMPRPPGLNADQPWYLESCGALKSSLDAATDPEAHR